MIRNEILFREVFNHANDVILISTEQNGKFAYVEVNETACKCLEYTKEELLQLGPEDITALEYKEKSPVVNERLKAEKSILIQWGFRTKSGRTIPMEVNIRYIELNGMVLYVAIARDISHHIKLQNELRQKNIELINLSNNMNRAMDLSNIMVCFADLKGRLTKVTSRYCEMLGYSEQELLSKNFSDITHPEYIDRDLQMFQQLVEQKIDTYEMEKPYITKSGSETWIYINCSLITDENNNPLYTLAYIKNIDEQKRLEERLIQSYSEYQKLIDFLPEAIYITKDTKILYMNKNGKEKLGMDKNKSYKDKSFLEFFHSDCFHIFEEIKKSLPFSKTSSFIQNTIVRKDGVVIDVESISLPITYHHQEAVLTIARDLTEVKKTARELQHLNDQLKLYIEEKDELITELRKFRHHYLNVLYGMSGYIEDVDAPALKSYFYSVLEDLEKLKSNNVLSIHKIKNHAIRGLLTNKIHDAQKNNIDFKIHVEKDIYLSEQLIKTKDFCQIVGMYLDEAMEEAKNTIQKRVEFGLINEFEYICVFVENSFKEKGDFDSLKMKRVEKILCNYKDVLKNIFVQNNKIIRELQIKK